MGYTTIVGKLAIFASKNTENGREHVGQSEAESFDVAEERDFRQPIHTGFLTHEEAFTYCVLQHMKTH